MLCFVSFLILILIDRNWGIAMQKMKMMIRTLGNEMIAHSLSLDNRKNEVELDL